ncbi:GGDEF domain-containing protein [Candidatus Daviesbacteria bacterium]|nr:GGDEF domain-containing protein [Candidatus Daviesbacteria bacterium]
MQTKEPEGSIIQTEEDPRFELYTSEYLKRFEAKYPEFTQEQVRKTIPFCEELALERVKTEDLADNDHLTDLLNRRGFYKYVTQRFQQYNREVRLQRINPEDIKASILYMDLDKFKLVNDTYGHKKGDEVLQTFSEIMKGMRSFDIVARYGGEEFTAFLDGEDGEGAVQTADRIRMDTSDLFHQRFPDLDWPKTISCGVYQLPPFTAELLDSGKDWRHLIEQAVHYADIAHYKGAKEAGRNKIGAMVPNGRIYTAVLLSPHGEPPKIHYQEI